MVNPEPRQDFDELLQDVADHTSSLALEFGFDEPTSEQFGHGLAQFLADHWGGQLIYVPKGHLFKLSRRDEEIFSEFTGTNHSDLAKKFKLSVQWIYRIVKRCRYRDPRQGRLSFDDPPS